MNPLLARLHPYPFERLRHLFADVTPPSSYAPISLGIGEPRHATPPLIIDALTRHTDELATYPATAGSLAFREACANWVRRRYGVTLNPDTQVITLAQRVDAATLDALLKLIEGYLGPAF